jgi:phosphatidylserine decarboxylase
MAPEGWPFIALGWGLAAVGAWAALRWGRWWWAPEVVVLLLACWLLVFFRDPTRTGPRGDGLVIAPADGHVVSVVEADEPAFLKTRAMRVSIFMSVFDVHVNRYPVSGAVAYRHYHAGKFLHAADDKASLDNEQSSVGLTGPHGPVLVRQIAGLIARRIVTDGRVGDPVEQGSRLGMIRFGSRVDVYLPLAARPSVKVAVGQRTLAGATVLAEYAR